MATAEISGVAALIRQARPSLSPGAGLDSDSGAGAVNALAAVRSLVGVPRSRGRVF